MIVKHSMKDEQSERGRERERERERMNLEKKLNNICSSCSFFISKIVVLRIEFEKWVLRIVYSFGNLLLFSGSTNR